MKTYDLIVIGFGKAGKTLAKYALHQQVNTSQLSNNLRKCMEALV